MWCCSQKRSSVYAWVCIYVHNRIIQDEKGSLEVIYSNTLLKARLTLKLVHVTLGEFWNCTEGDSMVSEPHFRGQTLLLLFSTPYTCSEFPLLQHRMITSYSFSVHLWVDRAFFGWVYAVSSCKIWWPCNYNCGLLLALLQFINISLVLILVGICSTVFPWMSWGWVACISLEPPFLPFSIWMWNLLPSNDQRPATFTTAFQMWQKGVFQSRQPFASTQLEISCFSPMELCVSMHTYT